MRSEFVYSCSIKNPCFRIQQALGKQFLPPAGCKNVFPAESCPDAWRSGCQLARGQVNVVEEAKLCGPICSTFEALVVRRVVGHCHGELGSSCDQYQLQALLFSVHLTDLPSILLRWNYFTKLQKAIVDQRGNRPPNSGWPWLFFGTSLALGSVLELLLV